MMCRMDVLGCVVALFGGLSVIGDCGLGFGLD